MSEYTYDNYWYLNFILSTIRAKYVNANDQMCHFMEFQFPQVKFKRNQVLKLNCALKILNYLQ